MTALDRWLSDPHVAARYSAVVPASQDAVFDALRRLDFSRPLPVRILMGLRALPASIAGRRAASPPDPRTRTLLGIGFTLLSEEPPREMVLGLEGRFWRLAGGVKRSTLDDFKHPVGAGLARAVWNFLLEPHPHGTLVSTETRVRCGDEASRRRFAAYWRVVGPFSGLIRRAILAELAREVSRARS